MHRLLRSQSTEHEFERARKAVLYQLCGRADRADRDFAECMDEYAREIASAWVESDGSVQRGLVHRIGKGKNQVRLLAFGPYQLEQKLGATVPVLRESMQVRLANALREHALDMVLGEIVTDENEEPVMRSGFAKREGGLLSEGMASAPIKSTVLFSQTIGGDDKDSQRVEDTVGDIAQEEGSFYLGLDYYDFAGQEQVYAFTKCLMKTLNLSPTEQMIISLHLAVATSEMGAPMELPEWATRSVGKAKQPWYARKVKVGKAKKSRKEEKVIRDIHLYHAVSGQRCPTCATLARSMRPVMDPEDVTELVNDYLIRASEAIRQMVFTKGKEPSTAMALCLCQERCSTILDPSQRALCMQECSKTITSGTARTNRWRSIPRR